MDPYRLFVYSDDSSGWTGIIVHAADDGEAVAEAEAMRGPFAAELLDVEGLRIVKYLPGNGEASLEAAE